MKMLWAYSDEWLLDKHSFFTNGYKKANKKMYFLKTLYHIDATYGRRTRAVIITDSDHVILSAVQPETVAHRLVDKDEAADEVDE